jgi:hypothetical protein
MTRHLSRFEEFRNINIQAELVRIGPRLAVRVHAAADVEIGSGWKRFSSEQHVSLENFFAGLREKMPPAPEAEVDHAGPSLDPAPAETAAKEGGGDPCPECGRAFEDRCYGAKNLKIDGGRNPHCPLRRVA